MKKYIYLITLLTVSSVFSQNSAILTFKESALADSFYLEFINEDIKLNFGVAHSKNNYNGYDLFLDDMSPNPKFLGKKFFVEWGNKTVETSDPIQPWKNIKIETPYIKKLILLNKNSTVLTFKESALVDSFYLEFASKNEKLNFGPAHSKNNYNGYNLFLDDMSTNPKYKGKKFFVVWGYKMVEVADPIKPWNTSKVKNPYIKYLCLITK